MVFRSWLVYFLVVAFLSTSCGRKTAPEQVPGDQTCEGMNCENEGASQAKEAPVQKLVGASEAELGTMVSIAGGEIPRPRCNPERPDLCRLRFITFDNLEVKPFKMDKYLTTVLEYRKCVDAGKCTEPKSGDRCNWGISGRGLHPVNCIDWNQARQYCAWAGKRLCSNSEWELEYASTENRNYPWGNNPPSCEYATIFKDGPGCGSGTTSPVGAKPQGASINGVMDMVGNVWEWVEDDWFWSIDRDKRDDGSAKVRDPRLPMRVKRGGSLGSHAQDILTDNMAPAVVTDVYYLGVRCCGSSK